MNPDAPPGMNKPGAGDEKDDTPPPPPPPSAPPYQPSWADPPPPPYEYPKETQTGDQHICDEDIREIIAEHIAETRSCKICCEVFCCRRLTCCWSAKPLQTMSIEPIDPSYAFTAKLQEYCEKRHTEWRYKPYHGGRVDHGHSPSIWEIDAGTTRREAFTTGNWSCHLPHSEKVQTCGRCHGCGDVRCPECHGCGKVDCSWCHGSGHLTERNTDYEGCPPTKQVSCQACHSGRVRCHRCHGCGHVTCPKCEGHGKLLYWLQLIVEWLLPSYLEVVQDNSKGSGVPKELVGQAQGAVLIDAKAPVLPPVTHFADNRINTASDIVLHQAQADLHGKIHLGHWLRIEKIPMSECIVQFKAGACAFYIYGEYDRLYFEDSSDYPTNCCFCCHRSASDNYAMRVTDNTGLNPGKKHGHKV